MMKINDLKLFPSFLIILLSIFHTFGQTTQTLGDKVNLAIKKELPELTVVEPLKLRPPYKITSQEIESKWKTNDGRTVSIEFRIVDNLDEDAKEGIVSIYTSRAIMPPNRMILGIGNKAILVSRDDTVEIKFFKENLVVDVEFGFLAKRKVGFYGPAPKAEEERAIKIAQVVDNAIDKKYTISPCFNDFQKPAVPESSTTEGKLFAAIIRSEVEEVKKLTKQSINFEIPFVGKSVFVRTSADDANKAIHLAVNQPCFEILKTLVAAKANINSTNRGGGTPLMLAIANRNLEYIRFLIESGANVNLKTNADRTAAFFVISFPTKYPSDELKTQLEILKLLINAGLNIKEKDHDGNTLLTYILKNNGNWSETVANFLLEQGIDVNEPDVMGQTALIRAIGFSEYNKKIIKFLTDRGAKVNIIDKYQKSALDYMLELRNRLSNKPEIEKIDEIIQILKDASAK